MSKKDLQAAAMTAAQKMVRKNAPALEPEEPAVEPEEPKRKKNPAPFTIWTTPENVRKWKAYQRAKKATLKTQNDFIVAAVTEYMQSHPATVEEVEAAKAEMLKSLEL